MSLAKYARLYRTLRHLKGQQLFYQMAYRVRRYAFWENPQASKESLSVASAWPKGLDLQRPTGADACLDHEEWYFKFVNLEHRFGSRIDWAGASHGKLWNYNLHYFEWLWGLEPEKAKAVCFDWIERNPFSRNAEGWEPYALSLRVTNWVGYWGSRGLAILEEDAAFAGALFHSLSLQCDWLTKRLETHILGNHYLENGVTLWLAGTFLEKGDSSNWRSVGQQILDEQLAEQMLEDGMHFERSPMYHNRMLWVLSWLSAIDEGQFGSRLGRAIVAARMLKHPDGKIALFNDSAFGIYPEVIGELPPGSFALKDSGYYGARNVAGDYLICDAGRIGPDYIPGHAHCDIGSFELSIAGERFIADTGVFHYLDSSRRHDSRSTAAHNVFAPENVEQAEIWSAFRVGRRPEVFAEYRCDDDVGLHLKVSHDGFANAGVSMSRTFDYNGKGTLFVSDAFQVVSPIKMRGRFHLAPEVEVLGCSNSVVRLKHVGREVEISFDQVDEILVGESDYYPEFNVCIKRPCIDYYVVGCSAEVSVRIKWEH